jgi:hypothetical protein
VYQKVSRSLRFAIDTIGKQTATWCQEILANRKAQMVSISSERNQLGHLVGLTGLPKDQGLAVRGHKVPIKLFHSNPELGDAISIWFEELLRRSQLIFPNVELVKGGLGAVNHALDRLRSGEISGKRLAVEISSS